MRIAVDLLLVFFLSVAACFVTKWVNTFLLKLKEQCELYELFGGIFNRWGSIDKEERRRILALQMPKIRVRDGKPVSVFRMLDGQEVKYRAPKLLPTSKRLRRIHDRIERVESECYDKKNLRSSSLSAPTR